MQAVSSEIKLKVRLKKGLGLPCHGIEISSDQTNTSLLHGRARHRLGWTQREEYIPPSGRQACYSELQSIAPYHSFSQSCKCLKPNY